MKMRFVHRKELMLQIENKPINSNQEFTFIYEEFKT
jgi:hypothetical protein